MYLEYDAIVPTSRNPGANHAKLRDFRVVLFGLYFSSSIRVYPFILLFSRESTLELASPRSNQLLRHREGIVVEDTQSSCVIY